MTTREDLKKAIITILNYAKENNWKSFHLGDHLNKKYENLPFEIYYSPNQKGPTKTMHITFTRKKGEIYGD